jgi:hypothetical protein
MTTPTLTEFLLARLDETVRAVEGMSDTEQEWLGERLVTPRALLLADIAAKRRIVERAASEIAKADAKGSEQIERSFNAGSAFFAHNTLLDLATPYADHPDYDQAWRP